ncbi:MAG: gamma-glutamyltransferase [Acetobacteraceae bacterium]|nr:gamma-glutamyltransferase [Acetobacteraceae bacterium]
MTAIKAMRGQPQPASTRARLTARAARLAASALLLASSGCSTLGSVGKTFFGGPPGGVEAQRLAGFIGAAVADEPRAALAGREILASGGTAADAAVAMGFMLGVTLPSRAGLGGGGACLAYNPSRTGPGAGSAEAILFTPVAGGAPGPTTDRPAAVPMVPRGLYALHVRYGKLPFDSLLAPAEQAARFGIPIPRALVQDLAVVAGPLLQDPNARAVFGPGGQPLQEGSTLQQPELAATIAALRREGVGDLYIGTLARRVADASALAGGGLQLGVMREALPRSAAPITLNFERDRVAFLPPPADGGLAAAAAFESLQAGGSVGTAGARAAAIASRWRRVGGDPLAVLASGGEGGSLPTLPASTGWLALDRDGNAVACTVTMDNLFGTGRIAPGTGLLLASAPNPAPLLSAALAWNPNLRGFRAAAVGTGQEGAPLATAVAMNNALHSANALPVPVPSPGRADAIACSRYLPDSNESCSWAVDPRTPGLAAGGN